MNRCLTLLVALLTLSSISGSALSASDFASIKGRPKVKIETYPDGAETYKLSKEQQLEYSMSIVRQGAEYIWVNRESKILIRSTSGIYDNFASPEGAGYVKISTFGGNCEYMEHVHQNFMTITYYGECEVG